MGGIQRGRSRGGFGNDTEVREIKAFARAADFARTVETMAVSGRIL